MHPAARSRPSVWHESKSNEADDAGSTELCYPSKTGKMSTISKKKRNFLLVILFYLPLEINVIFRRRDNDQVPLETDRRDGPIGNNP